MTYETCKEWNHQITDMDQPELLVANAAMIELSKHICHGINLWFIHNVEALVAFVGRRSSLPSLNIMDQSVRVASFAPTARATAAWNRHEICLLKSAEIDSKELGREIPFPYWNLCFDVPAPQGAYAHQIRVFTLLDPQLVTTGLIVAPGL